MIEYEADVFVPWVAGRYSDQFEPMTHETSHSNLRRISVPIVPPFSPHCCFIQFLHFKMEYCQGCSISENVFETSDSGQVLGCQEMPGLSGQDTSRPDLPAQPDQVPCSKDLAHRFGLGRACFWALLNDKQTFNADIYDE
ncbi:hypothetical protein KIN20_010873 [Parelaphostrongylus tenuis]|uniref:Uncharacterized protein n=1 Tax=Parelaphostrongylus tenuis TaxID=148309 RepID=A0AAD5MD68_PARTN|nr:hypothetical protein KIN20_010873 [Parelaphostrongylus tenuis]